MSIDEKLPGLLDHFDAVDLLALVTLLSVLALAAFDGLSLETRIVKTIVYACIMTMFGAKVLKGYNNGN